MNILRHPLPMLLLATLLGAAASLHAGPVFESAKITFIQHDVAVADLKIAETNADGSLKRSEATLNQSLTQNNAVITGQKSRAELQLNDGTLTRLGQLTSFTFKQGTRDIAIKQGSALFMVPKGMGGTKIQAGPVTAAITGTTLLVQVFSDRVVVFVYEGSVDIGDQSLRAGQVLSAPAKGGKATVSTFDTTQGAATGALFTKFIDAPSQRELLKQIKTGDDDYGHHYVNDVRDNGVFGPIVDDRHYHY